MTDKADSIDRQLGELSANMTNMLEKIDKLDTRVSTIQKDVEELKIEQASAKGVRKGASLISGMIGTVIGSAASILTILVSFGGLN